MTVQDLEPLSRLDSVEVALHTWSVAHRSVEWCTYNGDVKGLLGLRQTRQVWQMAKGGYPGISPLGY